MVKSVQEHAFMPLYHTLTKKHDYSRPRGSDSRINRRINNGPCVSMQFTFRRGGTKCLRQETKIQTVAQGLSSPTSIAFIDSKNILVLEKNTGNVRLISNGVLQPNSILTVSVNGANERGLLGVATLTNIKTFVFLYYTEQVQGQELRNRVYRYEWTGSSLSNPALILDLPALPGPNHNGGKLLV